MMADPSEPNLAEGLNHLFESIRPDGAASRRYTNEEVASAIREAAPGVRVSGAYLSALRKGTKKNPSTELLRALARFFGVSASYFLDPEIARRTETEIALAKVVSNPNVTNLALRALELSPEGLAAVSQIIDQVLGSGDSKNPRKPSPGNTPRE